MLKEACRGGTIGLGAAGGWRELGQGWRDRNGWGGAGAGAGELERLKVGLGRNWGAPGAGLEHWFGLGELV